MENTTKDGKKINITEEIVKRLNNIGYTGEISQLVKYYISENIKYLFGTEEICENDIELITSSDKIEIKSIYSEQTYYIVAGHKVDYDADYIGCDRKTKEDEQPYTEFEIVNSSTYCRSTLSLDESSKIKTLAHNAKDNKFTLTYWAIGPENKSKTYYKASLTPINAKEKDRDWFAYHREEPLETKGESFLKRLYDELKGVGANRALVTSYDVEDMVDYASVIYHALEDDATRVLQRSFEEKDSGRDEKKRIHNQ